MGYSGDIMHDIVQKEIKRNYPASEGWVITGSPELVGNNEIYTLSRRQGKNQVATVGATFERVISPELMSALVTGKEAPAAKKGTWHASLLVPQGTDISGIPEGIKSIFMRSFRYEGKDLLWLKRPAGSQVTTQSTQASS
ncbi:MAG: hypothetical protein MUF37_08465 [Methanoregulaceae archaeon]|nr:hypothetical protein [Methanoregulaceae archaeon]